MTREQAIEAAQAAIVSARTMRGLHVAGQATVTVQDLTVALEALGLLRLEEAQPKTHHVPVLSHESDGNYSTAMVREDHLIDTLRIAGYEVTKR